jgi:hypothetical protein
MLRVRYPSDRWALFDEVREGTGYNAGGSCDAMAFGLWPSYGLEIHGFEIKVSRADFLNELRNPDKAEAFRRYCDRWWLVAASRTIVKDDLPAGWGMLWPRSGSLVVSRGAPELTPEPMPREMMAAVFRRAAEGYADQDAAKKRYQEGLEAGRDRGRYDRERLEDQLERLSSEVAAFQEASGVDISKGWGRTGAKIGAAVDTVLNLRQRHSGLDGLTNRAKALERGAAEMGQMIRELEQQARALGLKQAELELEGDE